MLIEHTRSAMTVAATALRSQIMPPDRLSPSDWAKRHLVLPDGPRANELWDVNHGLHIIEIVDAMAPDGDDNEIVVMKSAQTGFTTAAIIFAGHSIDSDPCRLMIVQPTTGALSDFNRDKLQPAIDQTQVLADKVRPATSRSSEGSTATSKMFAGGSLTLAIASSAADLRSKTIKKVVCDEIDQYPQDLDQQGSPLEMIEARQIAFLNSGDWRRLLISTPTIKGASEIERRYMAGDQRKWHVKCPECGGRFVFEFDRKLFKFSDAFPFSAHYVRPCCGTIIEGHEKIAAYRTGEWIATAPKPGARKSYHFDALSSPLVPWDEIARKFVEADGDPQLMKAFNNLYLGLPYEIRGDAPDHVRLMERRETGLKRGHIPPMGLILTGAADVQLRAIYYEIKAFGPDRQSWVVDAGVIEGDTDDPQGGAFAKLAEVHQRDYPDAFGGRRRVDAFGVDSGFRSHVVYTWVRGRIGCFALKGLDGWHRPALGIGTPVDIDFNGKRIRNGTNVWGVGTWSLKGVFYADLRKEGIRSGQELDPPGYCHFGDWLDDVYFRQITSEYLGNENFKGRIRRVWMVRKGEENHLLDCAIYNMALADYLGLSRMTQDDWANLAAQRAAPEVAKNPDMFSPAPVLMQANRRQTEDRATDERGGFSVNDGDAKGSYWD